MAEAQEQEHPHNPEEEKTRSEERDKEKGTRDEERDRDRGRDRESSHHREKHSSSRGREKEKSDKYSRSKSPSKKSSSSHRKGDDRSHRDRHRDRDHKSSRKYRSRSRSDSRERRRDKRRGRSDSRSRSPSRRRKYESSYYSRGGRRDRRSRSRSYSPPKNSFRRPKSPRSSSLSPISLRQKLRQERIQAQANQLPNKFWDGFQWVERTTAVTDSTMQAVVEAINTSSTSSIAPPTLGTTLPVPAISLAQQKDRRIYLGNLPPDVTQDFLKDFMNSAMVACGAVPPGIQSAVLSVWLSSDNKYAFIELCTAESALVALGLNGISCMGHSLRVARPKTFNGS